MTQIQRGTVYCISEVDQNIVSVFRSMIEAIKEAHPEIGDNDEIGFRALDMLYEENEEGRWFRVTKSK